MGSSETNLKVLDDAFGEGTDLYGDVLGVQSNASAEQIQAAFLQRHRDLFQRLERNDATAERQMDAVVLAARILGDAAARVEYDDVRPLRILQQQEPAAADTSYTSQPPDGVDTSYTSYSTTDSGVKKRWKKKKKKKQTSTRKEWARVVKTVLPAQKSSTMCPWIVWIQTRRIDFPNERHGWSLPNNIRSARQQRGDIIASS
jgi:hypothetical protein